jgi:predicted phage terminase large subunit-like protein
MKRSAEYLQLRLQTCQRLFFQYNGREHARIEREMRAGGFPDFNRRCLYARGVRSGWIEQHGWDRELQCSVNSEQRTVNSRGNEVSTESGSDRGISSASTQTTSRQDAKTPSQNRLRQRAASSVGTNSATDNADQNGSANASVSMSSVRSVAKTGSSAPLNDFHAWIKKVSPPMFDWDAKHLKHVIEKLQLVTEGKIKRLMIFMPPRHGKSELVTIRYTAWRLMKDPKLKVILASYAQALANRFSRNIRNTLAEHFSQNRLRERAASSSSVEEQDIQHRDAETQSQNRLRERAASSSANSNDPKDSHDSADTFSNPFNARIINSAQEWETGKGGGVKAVGVGGGITGYGAGLMMIDDPIKSREQAESQVYRDKVWHWFNEDMMTRLEPDAPVILIQTRWHEDDLAGRLLKQQQEEGTDEWHVVSLPAIAETVDVREGGTPGLSDVDISASRPPAVTPCLQPARHLAFTTQPPYVKGQTYGDIIHERESQNRLRQRAASSVSTKEHENSQNISRQDAKTPSQNRLHQRAASSVGTIEPDLQRRDAETPSQNNYTDPSLATDHWPLSTSPDPPQYPGHRANDRASSMALPWNGTQNSKDRLDPLGRAPGEALWPERFPVETLERTRRQMGTYSFESLYQQKPVPTEGGMFKRSWFTIVQTPPPNLNWKRGYDLSFTANPDSDPSATLKVAYDKDGTVYIDSCFRGKLTYPLQRKMLMHYIKTETRTEHGIELSANGHAILQDLRQMPELRGKKFGGVKVETNKLTRALPWIALAEEGRVRLVAGRWNEDFITEACSFPHGHNDDQIDAVSIAVAMHGKSSGKRLWRF